MVDLWYIYIVLFFSNDDIFIGVNVISLQKNTIRFRLIFIRPVNTGNDAGAGMKMFAVKGIAAHKALIY